MTREQPAAEDPSAQRRFTYRARLWILVILALAAALLYLGQFAVALGVIAAGLVGFAIVFDARRPWWGPELRAMTATSSQGPADRRRTLALGVVLVVMTVGMWAVFLLSQR